MHVLDGSIALLNLKDALQIDFSGKVPGFQFHDGFGEKLISTLRNGSENKLVIMIDNCFGLDRSVPYVVKDHLNLTGTNPLIGPNNSCGPRFPVVNNIYLTDFPKGPLSELTQGIAAGLKYGTVPTLEELDLLKSLGADFYCYHLVPSMIVAAHSGWKVVGIVVPETKQLDSELMVALAGSA
jgi:hypothetical protein